MKPGAPRAPKATTDPNAVRAENEVVYPFGVQNDLGHVVLTRNAKSSREDGRGDGCPGPPDPPPPMPPGPTNTPPPPLPPVPPLSPCHPPQPPEPELLSPRVLTASVSHLSLQSTRHNSLASSLSDLSYDVAVLERALRTNDVARVKKCFEKHRHRFQLLERSQHKEETEGTNNAGGATAAAATAGPSSQSKSRPSEINTAEMEENPVVFTNALHLAVEWGANDALRYLLREGVDPNKGGRLPDVYDISVAGSRSASVSAWGSGCVFCPPSPRNISRDVSPSREMARIFSRNSSRNVSSESSRCVSPCRDRLWSAKGMSEASDRSAHLRREAFKNLSAKCDDKTESSNGDQDNPGPSEVRPIISVVYCTSEERRPSSARPSGEIVLPGSGSGSGNEKDTDDWAAGGPPRRMNRRVSWVSSLREPADKNRMTLATKLRKQKLRLPRQRSFSLESELELRTVAKRAVGVAGALASIREARRSISLKSSPLHFPWHFRRESSSVMREGGVFAELRRSSEIFRNILLSIAGREESTPTDEDQYDLEGKDLSFSSLLAAHGRRRSERSVSYSSCSWSDVSIGSETLPRKLLSINPSIPKGLLVVSVESRGREVTFAEHYTSSHLMTLPPVYLAACRGRATPMTLLLQFGAKSTINDSLGNTPLHLAVIQSPTPWDPILDLMESGAKITTRNEKGISPLDLLPPLSRLQKQLVADCWLGLVLEDAAHMTEHSEQGGPRETSSRSSRLFKKLHEARHHRQDKGDLRGNLPKQTLGRTMTSGFVNDQPGGIDSLFIGTEGPTCMNQACPSKVTQKGSVGDEGSDSKKKLRRKKDKSGKSHVEAVDTGRLEWSELARCLLTLKSVASNDECLDEVLQGLVLHRQPLLRRFQQVPPATDVPNDPHTCLSGLLHTLISVVVKSHGNREEPKKSLSEFLSVIASSCLLFATGPHPLQYTAMVAINKIVDVCIVHRITKESREIDGEKPAASNNQLNPTQGPSPRGSSSTSKSNSKGQLPKTHRSKDSTLRTCSLKSGQDLLGILEPAVGPVVNILHNAVTLYKRTIGSRQICTPSVRRRTCSAHCLQLLSARLLVFLAHSPTVQKSLVSEAPLRIFIAALDATHDPQLLCLVLQILATLALDPAHHKPLIDAGVADALPPLLLPADEFFYTNHTTLFARYVKHHAARLLVYLGLHHRSALRVSVFDLITADESTTVSSGTLGNEDLFITWTCSTPPPVLGHPNAASGTLPSIIVMSVESTLIRVLKSLESSVAPGSPYLREPSSTSWLNNSPSRNCFSPALHIRRHSAEAGRRDSIGGPELDPAFVRIFQTCYSAVVHPIILLRLLLHRLLTTGLALRRWKSCASRASFASAYSGHSGHSVFSMFSGESRTSRSRASSTDTESLPLRRRRQVSLTLDCGPGININEGEESQVLHEMEENTPTEPLPPLSPTKKASSIRGIFSKWRSSSQEASVDRTDEMQRLAVDQPGTLMGAKPRESSIFGLLPLAALRAAASRESLQGGSGPNSQANTPMGSPSFLAKQSFRFGSLHQRKTRRLSRNRSLDVSTEATSPKDTPEDEILAFQKRLQNLPDFLDSSIEPPSPPALAPTSPRPRSRSVPKVTLDAPLPLILPGLSTTPPPTSPTLPLPPPAAHLLSPSSPIRNHPMNLPQPLPPAPSSPGLLTPHSPKGPPRGGTPFGEEKGSQIGSLALNDRNDISRRSSVSPMSSGTRRNDSIFISDMPVVHRAVLVFVEDWITTCRPHGKNSVIRELKDFVARVSSCGPPYLRWADHIRMLCPSLVTEDDGAEMESLEAIEHEYWEMQRLVVSGSLPCSKDEAAVLAGIQLRLEECWPRARPPRPTHQLCPAGMPLSSPAPLTPNLTTDRSSTTKTTDDDKDSSLAPLMNESPIHGRSGLASGDGGGDEHIPEEITTKKTSGVGRAVHLLTTCYSSSDDNEMSLSASTKLEDLVPPCYVHAGNMPRLIKDQKRKLFHTSVYESATQLQKLYVQTCRRLPAYGCRLVVVKELLRGKTKKKAARLLGIGPEKIILLDCRTRVLARSQITSDLIQWRAGGGRNHDRLILEFRGTRWSLLVPPAGSGSSCGVSCGHLGTVGGLREAGRALWALLREMDTHFLDDFTFHSRAPLPAETGDSQKRRWKIRSNVSPELEQLEKVLHFPEEVGLALADTESQLFCQVAPLEYLRHVTMDLGIAERCTDQAAQNQLGVNALIDRFNEISSWITHLLVSPPTHEERKAMLSCLLRVARTAWNLGAFGTAVEIIAGLKSSKLKPFWLSLHEKEHVVPTLDVLTKALLGEKVRMDGEKADAGENDFQWSAPEYDSALQRALKIPTCLVVPFFGAYLKELRVILSTPSLVVLSSVSEQHQLQVLSDTVGEDDFCTKVGPGSLLNMNKLRKVQTILEKISMVHQHHTKRQQRTAFLHADRLSIHTSSIERAGFPDEDHGDTVDDLFSGSVDLTDEFVTTASIYQPVQPLHHDHAVSFTPLDNSRNSIDLHVLQVMHHGSTALHIDSDGRAAFVWVKLERSCGTVTWSKPVWSSLRFQHAQPDFLLSVDPEHIPVPAGLVLKYGGVYGSSGSGPGSGGTVGLGGTPDIAGIGLEEGYIDLNGVKEVESGNREVDVTAAMKRFAMETWSTSETCISLVYGMVLSDNRSTVFVFPPRLASTWLTGLRAVVKSLRRVVGRPDRRLFWLKEQYLQLYFEDGRCLSPTMADAIRVFGGRRWSSTAPQGNVPDTPPFRRTASVKFRKKRSLANIHMIKDTFIKGTEHPEPVHRPPSPATRPKTEMGESSTPPTPPHQPPQSLTRIKSAISMVPSPIMEGSPSPQARVSALTHETRLSFTNFVALFQAFSLRSRKDLRDLFDSISTVRTDTGPDTSQPGSPERSHSSSASGTTPKHASKSGNLCSANKPESKFIYDAIASASIVQNGAGVETSRSRVLSLSSFSSFLKTQQGERKVESEVKSIIESFEPDTQLRSQHCMSFEGFARYMMSGNNLAFVSERIMPEEAELDHPFAHYYVAASHNTYLTGHQLKGESSVELYSQVLLTGCRCVELDCWDGDDGDPVIYHGHTFTTKIPFRQVVDAINKSAFLASSYPVILSIENHCSLQQQSRMALTFQTVFGDKLVTRFLFDVDFTDDPCLPSPSQLKNRILIKNKKCHAEIIPNPTIHPSSSSAQASTNPPIRNRSGSRPQSGRTNSIVSNVSGGSINDEYSDDDVESDYEDEIPDERLVVSRQASEQALPITPRTDSLTSQESSLKSASAKRLTGVQVGANAPVISSQYQTEQGDWIVELEDAVPKTKKQSSQIARELSDLVIYIQAIKFRGLSTLSPSSSVRNKILQKKIILPPGNPPTSLPVTPTSSTMSSSNPDHHPRRVISNHPVYQCCSINENAAKKLCRKQPLQVMAHTETQLIRAYPAGMRIDSSNFNPLIFWSFGIQMVALNYQTEDAALHMNAAMFEQNGRCGYVLKPAVMWDRNHVMYRRFNPLEKEFDGLHTVHLHLTIISGQFLSPSNYQASPQVEVEVLGIPVDCAKQKTRIISRNALNPIWSETLSFTIQFRDLAFIRFTVLDGGSGGSGSGHTLSQRVIPLKGLRQGYRHLRLRNIHNQPLPVTTLFIHSRLEEEGEEVGLQSGQKILSKEDSFPVAIPALEGSPLTGQTPVKTAVPLKRRMFFLVVYGVVPDEPYTILKVTQDTTASEVINNALQKSGRTAESAREYVLIEEVARGWDAKEKDLPPTQRVLDPMEKPLQSQSQWKGDGKFILKRTGNDPSSRAWLSSISARGGRFNTDGSRGDKGSRDSDELKQWGDEDNFLVCVYNVSPEIPYAILKVPVKSTAQDIIAQAFVKARRLEDPSKFVLVEELEPMVPSTSGVGTSDSAGSFKKKSTLRGTNRILDDNENVYEVQLKWNTVGRFVLRERKQAYSMFGGTPSSSQSTPQSSSSEKPKQPKGIRASTLARLTKLKLSRNGNTKHREKARQYLTERHALSLHDSSAQMTRPRKSRPRRAAHSEGETLSDEDHTDADFKATVARLKKVSLRKFRMWKS
ncbi:unnamed protein product [Allacma fusca]|uniref:phosphoinositide phospholipase C n=1 Tax=Allacma fusca TaxID=39272 RepID=A0A8J2KE86_9HEXA|nr:unnamed protein product [Allacma fusca]